jgi:hypothetical protein
MQPTELTKASFAVYPPQAQAFAVAHLALLQQLPLTFVPLLLREIITYDVRFPAERRTLDDQFVYLESLSRAEREHLLAGFAAISVSPELSATDWVQHPQQFSEAFTAHLWATNQIDNFHASADQFASAWRHAKPDPAPVLPRMSIVLVGRGVSRSTDPLFRKLRPQGIYFQNVDPTEGLAAVLKTVAARAEKHPVPYQHWYIDGGAPAALDRSRLSTISYSDLAPVRAAILRRMQSVIASGKGGPEALRTLLAETRPEDLGMSSREGDAVLNHFKVSILAEGSGTQIFSTTFAQWSAREAMRRAQPVTMLVRFAPRQRQLPMNELLAGVNSSNAADLEGSLVDADMGAYYTWINQQRLSGSERSVFLAWFEGQNQAVAIGPSLPRGTTSSSSMTVEKIIANLS